MSVLGAFTFAAPRRNDAVKVSGADTMLNERHALSLGLAESEQSLLAVLRFGDADSALSRLAANRRGYKADDDEFEDDDYDEEDDFEDDDLFEDDDFEDDDFEDDDLDDEEFEDLEDEELDEELEDER